MGRSHFTLFYVQSNLRCYNSRRSLELANCSHVKPGPIKRVAQRHVSQEPGKRIALKVCTVLRTAVPVTYCKYPKARGTTGHAQYTAPATSSSASDKRLPSLLMLCCVPSPAIGDSDSFFASWTNHRSAADLCYFSILPNPVLYSISCRKSFFQGRSI